MTDAMHNDRDASAAQRFYELLWRHAPHLLRVATILVGGPKNSADAEDLAQETMLKAYRAIDQFQPGTDARKWLTTILRNTRVDRVRAGARESGTVSFDDLPFEPPGDREQGEADWNGVDDPQALLEQFSD